MNNLIIKTLVLVFVGALLLTGTSFATPVNDTLVLNQTVSAGVNPAISGEIDLSGFFSVGSEIFEYLTVNLNIFDAPPQATNPVWTVVSFGTETFYKDLADHFISPAIIAINLGADALADLSVDGKISYTIGSVNPAGWENTNFTLGSLDIDGSAVPIPEPATMILVGFGLTGLAGFGRKKIKK